jgi:asparagine N-glycosylation enzyme membrane subunit Stt3
MSIETIMTIYLPFNMTSILAQINVGATPASLLGILIYFLGAGFCSVALFHPHLARYHDILFAQFILICSFILIFQGWRLDPILQLAQLMLVGMGISSVVDCVRLRRTR